MARVEDKRGRDREQYSQLTLCRAEGVFPGSDLGLANTKTMRRRRPAARRDQVGPCQGLAAESLHAGGTFLGSVAGSLESHLISLARRCADRAGASPLAACRCLVARTYDHAVLTRGTVVGEGTRGDALQRVPRGFPAAVRLVTTRPGEAGTSWVTPCEDAAAAETRRVIGAGAGAC